MTRLRVGVLRGGPSGEYDVSLKSGGTVLKHLDSDRYHVHDILLDKNAHWHLDGRPTDFEKLARHIDVVFNALHGTYGEDGQVQRLFDRFGITYTGSGPAASAAAMHKREAKDHFVKHGIQTPPYKTISLRNGDVYEAIQNVFRTLPGPYIVKPVASGSSLGIRRAHGFHELVEAVRDAFQHGPTVLIEEYIRGTEATCGVVEGFRGEEFYALPPVEIVLPAQAGPDSSRSFFDYEAKYGGGTRELCPAMFPQEVKEALMEQARAVHKALGLSHYSRSDFIISPRGIYVLEVNTLPGLTDKSLLPKSVTAVGATLSEFFDHIIDLARKS